MKGIVTPSVEMMTALSLLLVKAKISSTCTVPAVAKSV